MSNLSEYNFFLVHPLSCIRYVDKIMPQLTESIAASTGERDPASVFDNVLTGEWLLVVGEEDGEYAGFGMLEAREGVKTKQLNLPFGFSPGTLKGVREFFEFVEDFARQEGFDTVNISSCREGYDKFAQRLGYEPTMVEYTKEV